MVELAQRMLIKRPTVARTSETALWWPVARSPTLARDPRTEITRPKEVSDIELSFSGHCSGLDYGGFGWRNG
jgi:hypothetical protein